MNRTEIQEHADRTETYPAPFHEIIRETEKAVCLDFGFLVWLPKSQIEMAPCDDDCPSDAIVFAPYWLARNKGLTRGPRYEMAY